MATNTTGGNAFVKNNEAKAGKGKLKVKETSQELVAANSARVELYVFNPSSKEVWLALGGTAVKAEGIWLKKESGAVVIPGYTGVVSCITSEGEGEISYCEV